MTSLRILLIEDDELLGETLFDHLKLSYGCLWAQTIEEASALYKNNKIDAIVSDFKVHGKTSLEFLKSIAQSSEKTPFIVISGYVDKNIAIEFLNQGARFLLEKPFKLEELDLLLNKIFSTTLATMIEDKNLDLVINTKVQSVTYHGNLIDLTPTEFRLLVYFLVHRGEVLSKKDIERLLWGDEDVSRNLIYTHIGNLKKKIPSVNQLVQSKKGSLFIEKN